MLNTGQTSISEMTILAAVLSGEYFEKTGSYHETFMMELHQFTWVVFTNMIFC